MLSISRLMILATIISLAGCATTVSKQSPPYTHAGLDTSVYLVPFSAEPVKVDGNCAEPVWRKARVISLFIPVTFNNPISLTEARMAYDNSYFYVAFKAYDKDVASLLVKRDDSTFKEDVLEVFLKPDPRKDSYCNFEINALGTIMDAYNAKTNVVDNYPRGSRWNCAGLQVAIKIQGTLNNKTDVDEYWTMEAGIPLRELPPLEGRLPARGDTWLYNLSRYDYSAYLPGGVELSASAPLSKVNFHRYQEWAKLKFE